MERGACLRSAHAKLDMLTEASDELAGGLDVFQ